MHDPGFAVTPGTGVWVPLLLVYTALCVALYVLLRRRGAGRRP